MAETTLHRIKGDAYGVIAPAEGGPTVEHSYGTLGFCYRGGQAVIARTHLTEVDGEETAWALEFVTQPRDQMPHLSPADGDLFFSIELTEDELGFAEVYGMLNGLGDSFYCWFTVDRENIRLARIYMHGEIAVEVSYGAEPDETPTETMMFSTFLQDRWIFSTEVREGVASQTGPPFSANQRLVRRNAQTLEVEATYLVPNPSTYDGWSINTSGIAAIVWNAGMVRAYFYYIKNPSGGADTKVFHQDFTRNLALSGSAGGFASNPSPFIGYGNNLKRHPLGGIIACSTTTLRRLSVSGVVTETVLTGINRDQGSLLGIAQINDAQTLIVGGGNQFTTSILDSGGQQGP